MSESVEAMPKDSRCAPSKLSGWLALLGPGLITGASDDDPSGIATYSQVGAQFGYSMPWIMIFSYPLMAGIQEICGRIGRVTGRGIAGNLRTHFPAWLLRLIVGFLLLANIINLGADLGAMGDALALLIGGSGRFYVVLFAVGSAGLEIFSDYHRYVSVLKWTTLALFAYVATVMVVGVPWTSIAGGLFIPKIVLNTDYITAIVAVMGTTISPYLFFWQSSQEAEDEECDPVAKPLIEAPSQAPAEIARIRADTLAGMGFSNFIALCIMLTTAATLNANGITDIQTSAQAAEALRPLAGPFAFFLFALGIIGTGLLAIPVLAGSAAYALSEVLGWPIGLSRRPSEAKAFYGAITCATLLGIGINFTAIDPIKALFWSAVLNGIIAVPLMVIIMLIAQSRRIMGAFLLPAPLAALGWMATAVMGATVAAMFALALL